MLSNNMVMSSMSTPPSYIERGKMHFLIFDAPNDKNIQFYIDTLKKHGVSNVVRACDPDGYDKSIMEKHGIHVHEMPFPDGGSPPEELLTRFLDLADTVFNENPNGDENHPAIGVHCVAGLGRAPVLVAIALIEAGGLDPLEAIDFIRRKRKGAINANQLQFLKKYRRRRKSKKCIIM